MTKTGFEEGAMFWVSVVEVMEGWGINLSDKGSCEDGITGLPSVRVLSLCREGMSAFGRVNRVLYIASHTRCLDAHRNPPNVTGPKAAKYAVSPYRHREKKAARSKLVSNDRTKVN